MLIIVELMIVKTGILILVIVKIIVSNVVYSSINENRVNLSNFLNNECVNIYVTWYRLYNFLLEGRDAIIIYLNYKKEWDILFKSQIVLLGAICCSLYRNCASS